MKIVHVITRLILGGAQENTILTCEGLHARGHDVTLITGPALGPEGELEARARAVGSTSVRTLETVAGQNQGRVVATDGASSIFIYPPYAFQATDAMLTNFHLPQSTLIMMVSAFAGRDLIRRAYQEAVNARYRFFSYGDCMLIL